MTGDELRRRSRWILRVLEWDEVRARYPNIWHDEMPRNILALHTVACRLKLGDLIAVYYPASRKHPERAERFLGLSRVVGLRRSDREEHCWIDLETAHRLKDPLSPEHPPRRVFLCCDSGWPEQEVSLFQQVFDAAVAEGWQPTADEAGAAAAPAPDEAAAERPPETEPPAPAAAPVEPEPADRKPAGEQEPVAPTATGEPARPDAPPDEPQPEAPPSAAATETEPPAHAPEGEEAAAAGRPTEEGPRPRLFGGVDYSGDMRDPREATWLALLELERDRLRVVRLEATGRHGLHSHLRNPDSALMHVEAIGLDFPFGLPLPFAEKLLDRPFPAAGWWALVKRLEKLTRPDYLVAIQEFRDANGEAKRLTDERAQAFSPLHRINPDLGPMTYHGVRMIAEERSRYVVRPFESAQGTLLLEVYPGALVRRLKLDEDGKKRSRNGAILEALGRLDLLPVTVESPFLKRCLSRRDAIDAVIAARLAAAAVISGEAGRTAEELAPEHGEQVRREGWIYGLAFPPASGSASG